MLSSIGLATSALLGTLSFFLKLLSMSKERPMILEALEASCRSKMLPRCNQKLPQMLEHCCPAFTDRAVSESWK